MEKPTLDIPKLRELGRENARRKNAAFMQAFEDEILIEAVLKKTRHVRRKGRKP